MPKAGAHSGPHGVSSTAAPASSPQKRHIAALDFSPDRPMSPDQIKRHKQILSSIEAKEKELKARAAIISGINPSMYDSEKELPHFCVALYFIRTVLEIERVTRERGTEKGFLLFSTSANSVLREIKGNFFSLSQEALAARFEEMRSLFDACSIELGVRSLPLEQVLHDYGPLAKMFIKREQEKSKG